MSDQIETSTLLYIRLVREVALPDEEVDFKIDIHFHGTLMGELSGKTAFLDNSIIPLAIRSLGFELGEPGDLRFSLTIYQNSKEVLTHVESIRVEVNDKLKRN